MLKTRRLSAVLFTALTLVLHAGPARAESEQELLMRSTTYCYGSAYSLWELFHTGENAIRKMREAITKAPYEEGMIDYQEGALDLVFAVDDQGLSVYNYLNAQLDTALLRAHPSRSANFLAKMVLNELKDVSTKRDAVAKENQKLYEAVDALDDDSWFWVFMDDPFYVEQYNMTTLIWKAEQLVEKTGGDSI